jgi:hypothetical protein
MSPEKQQALTLAEAAARLGVTPQRVSQMLATGALRGPAVTTARAAKNAERVWVSAVEEALAQPRHRRHHRQAADSLLEERVAALEARLQANARTSFQHPEELERLANLERAARESALHLKVAADAAMAALGLEQKRTRELGAEVARLRGLVEEAQRRAEVAETVRQAFGDGLTQLLAPGDAAGV